MDSHAAALRSLSPKLVAAICVAVMAALAAGYYLFLRTDYAVLYSDMRPADAAAVVAELDEQGIGYELRDGGSTIVVPADSAAPARIAIAGSDIPAAGAVGFELFNESDMGLTDFAQRINYQRALQGELARTIMMMDGIESARVHLALPERSLFRGNRTEPSAAVTVSAGRGATIEAGRVVGIQRLVAAAVPDLAAAQVVVLDDLGRMLSAVAPSPTALPGEAEEHAAVQQYFRGRARSAIQNVLADIAFDVRVEVVAADAALAAETWAAPSSATTPSGRRNFALRVTVVTADLLAAADQELIRNAVTGAVELDEQNGDMIAFAIEPAAVSMPPPPVQAVPQEPAAVAERSSQWSDSWWPSLGLLAAIVAGLLIARRRRRSLSDHRRGEFVERVREQLRLVREAGHG